MDIVGNLSQVVDVHHYGINKTWIPSQLCRCSYETWLYRCVCKHRVEVCSKGLRNLGFILGSESTLAIWHHGNFEMILLIGPILRQVQ